MKDDTSIFGAKPDNLDRLLRFGLEPPQAEECESSQMASMDVHADKPGGRIDKYKLLRVLGEGGMGIVYLARQEEPVKRKVALKIIKPGMDSKRVLARFEVERQALALLDHANIAHVYDAGTADSGRPYFVMEYVKGMPITEFCDHHTLSIEQRLRLFQQVCQAVQHAHQKGIIHRDIKPSNILIISENDHFIPKIIDFGLAKAIIQPLTERTLYTEQGQLFGTPEYMSPEQADMVSEDIDTRSDVYSLGVLLYVLLTGVLPFDPQTLRDSGIENIRRTIRETDPKTPSTRLIGLGEEARKIAEMRRTQISTLARHLKRELEWIPLKAMRKERSERYRSASELADDVENYLNGVPLIAGPTGIGYKLKKFVRRNRVLVGGIAAVLVVLFAGVVVSTVFAIGQARARAEAERQANISQAVNDFLRNDLLASVDPAQAKGRELTVRSFLDTASGNLEGKFVNEPLVEASIRATLGWTYRMLGELKAAEPHLERALRIREEQLGPEHPETIEAMGQLAWVYFDQGRYGEAQRLCVNAVEMSRRIFGDEHPTTLTNMKFLGYAYMSLGRYDEAEQLYSKTVQTSRRVLGEENAMGIGHLAHLYQRQGRYADAEGMCLKLGDTHPHTLESLDYLIALYESWGKPEKAQEWGAKLPRTEASEQLHNQ